MAEGGLHQRKIVCVYTCLWGWSYMNKFLDSKEQALFPFKMLFTNLSMGLRMTAKLTFSVVPYSAFPYQEEFAQFYFIDGAKSMMNSRAGR